VVAIQNIQKLTFNHLPQDNFGVYVENEIDRRKLLWIANKIGETKLRSSAAKRNKYYPDSPLFVSTIIKRLRLKVPTEVYAPVNVLIYRIYILVLRDKTCLKIGMTGRWPDRSYDFVKTAEYLNNVSLNALQLFDSDLSIAFNAKSESDARVIESSLKSRYLTFSVSSPYERGLIPWGSGGHTEWFQFNIYDELVNILKSTMNSCTLGTAIKADNL